MATLKDSLSHVLACQKDQLSHMLWLLKRPSRLYVWAHMLLGTQKDHFKSYGRTTEKQISVIYCAYSKCYHSHEIHLGHILWILLHENYLNILDAKKSILGKSGENIRKLEDSLLHISLS